MSTIQLFFRSTPSELTDFLAQCGIKAQLGLPPEMAVRELRTNNALNLSGLVPTAEVPVGAQVLHAISPEAAKKYEVPAWGCTRPQNQRVVKFSLVSPNDHQRHLWVGTPHPLAEVGFEFTCVGVPDIWVREAAPHVRWTKTLWDVPASEEEAACYGVCGAIATSWDGDHHSVHIPLRGLTSEKRVFLRRRGWVDTSALEFTREHSMFPAFSADK